MGFKFMQAATSRGRRAILRKQARDLLKVPIHRLLSKASAAQLMFNLQVN